MCGGGSKNTTTQNTTSSLPPQVAQAYQAMLGYGTGLAQLPLQQYGGPRYAGFTPNEESAFNLAETGTGMGMPFVNQASDWYGSAAQPIWPQIPQYNSANLQPYMNPWQQDVIDSTMADVDHYNAVDRNKLMSDFAGTGALYGDRAGVGMAELMRGQGANRATTLAGLRSAGFSNAQSQFGNQQQLQLNGMGADASRYMQGAAGMQGLGQAAQSMNLNDITSLLRNGGLQRELAQNQINVPYQDFQEQQNYPFKIAQLLQGITSGTGSQGMNTTTSTTTPGPSPIAQIAGLGLSLLGLPGSSLGGGFLAGLLPHKRGGAVAHRAYGGPVGDYDAGGVPHIDAGAFTVPPSGKYSPSTWMNPLPQYSPNPMPPPRTTQLPGFLQNSLSKFPNYVKMPTTPTPGSGGTGGTSGGGGLAALIQQILGSFGNGGLSGIFDQIQNGDWSHYASGGKVGMAAGGPTWQPGDPDYTRYTSGLGPKTPGTPQQAMKAATERRKPGISPLLYMGLGMMASKSPYHLGGMGEGAITGLDLMKQQQESMDQGAQVVKDKDGTYKVYYPSTGETIETGIEYEKTPADIGPLETVTGPDGKPTLVPRSQAVGMSPYQKPENEPTTYDQWKLAKNAYDARNKDATKPFPDYDVWLSDQTARGAVQVNMGPNGVDYGKPDDGNTWLRVPGADGKPEIKLFPDGPGGELLPRQTPTQGSKAYKDSEGARAAAASTAAQKRVAASIVITNLDTAIDRAEDNPFTNSGWFAQMTAGLSGFEAFDQAELIKTVQSHIGLDKLREMREGSTSGASGLGSLTQKEMEILQAVQGSLAIGQSPEVLVSNLHRVRNVWQDLVSGGKIKAISMAIDSGQIKPADGQAQIDAIVNAGTKRDKAWEDDYKTRMQQYAPR